MGWRIPVLFAVLLLGSGLISASETALFSLDKLDLVRLKGSSRWDDRLTLALLLRPNDTLITILTLNNLLNIAASLTAGAMMERALGGVGPLAFAVAALTATAGILVVGEIIPKTLAHLYARQAVRWLAPPLAAADWLLAPTRRVVGWLIRGVLHRLDAAHEGVGAEVSEQELKVMIDSGEFASVLEEDEREMIDGVFDLRRTVAAEIMTPRMAVVALPDHLPQAEMVDRLRRIPHSRVPIYHETLDQLLGYLLVKEVLLDESGDWRRHLREALCVPERIGLLDLLKTFRKQRIKIAVVVDEFGGVAGLVTLQDVLEEIVGDIYEKHEPRLQPMVPLGEAQWRVNGSTPLEEVGEVIGVRFPEHRGRTLGGFIMNSLGRVPQAGDAVEFEGWQLVVEKMTGRRVQAVRIARAPAPTAPSGDEGP